MELPIYTALGMSALGFSIVFFVLIALMVMIVVMRGVVEQMGSAKPVSTTPTAAAAAAPAKDPSLIPAKGSLGDIKLYDVDDKTAAMIMAIVADTMEAPLNELRFLSIREKK